MDEEEIVYPKPGDTLIDQTQAKILFTNWYASDWQAFPFAYKAAADALVDRLEEDRGNYTMVPDDKFVFPILYLYRHFVELQLKSLIVQLDHFTQQPIKKFNIHILPTLWNHIKDNLHHLSHSEVNLNDIGALDSLITELSSLDEKSTNFRYPEESPSQPPHLPRSLSMDNLKSVMTAIGNALTLVESAIDSEKAYWYAQDEDWSEEEESIIPWINYEFY